jgi:CBS domain containing-hemolysin-like protein
VWVGHSCPTQLILQLILLLLLILGVAFAVAFEFPVISSRKLAFKFNTKVKGVGQECPTHIMISRNS